MQAQTRRRRSLAFLLGLGALAVGAGAFLVGSSLPTAEVRLVGNNVPIDAGATDLSDISANNSPTLVRNPARLANLVVVNRVDSPSFSCAFHFSTDAGRTWRTTAIPFPEGEELPARCFAPDADFGPDGTLYLSFVTLAGFGNTPHAAWISTSSDGGRTLGTPSRTIGPLAFQVRVLADPITAGRLYLTWLQVADVGLYQFPSKGNPVMFARSDDGGGSWSRPVEVNSPSRSRVLAPSAAIGPKGILYVIYLDLRDDVLDYHGAHAGRGGEPYPGQWSLVLARSRDDGTSWQEAVVDDGLVPTERMVVFLPPLPSLAVDRESGRVYASYHDASLGDADVWIWRSSDGGRTFTARRRVNDTPLHDGTSQYLPRLSVAPGGRVDLVYYDRRADPDDVMNTVALQSSFDGGATFTSALRLSDRSFDSRVGSGSERGMPDLGNRLALVSTDDRIMAAWTDTRAGNRASAKQDLARRIAAYDPGSNMRSPARTVGGVVGGVGAVIALVSLAGMARRRPGAVEPKEPAEPAAGVAAEPATASSAEPTG